MSGTTPTKGGKSGWTDTEKIMSKMGGKIPWSEIELPEGRTLKAVQVMVDKEKAKIRNINNSENPSTPASTKKRGSKAAGIDGAEGSPKKRKTPAKGKKSVKASSDDEDEDTTKSEESAVKAESADEMA